MEGRERGTRWKNLKERLGLKGMNCCGATWGFRPSNMSAGEDDEHDEYYYIDHQLHERAEVTVGEDQLQAPENSVVDVDPACVGQNPAGSGMNLATALAAERHFRAAQDSEGRNMVVAPTGTATVTATATATVAAGVGTNAVPGTPLRASLMRLLMEADGVDEEREKGGGGTGMDAMCCVCMGRRKGAAFIPCGHTFCRVCSRELWLNRGSCPLCNRSILEILDIF